MTKAQDQISHSMKEQAYNVDRDKDYKSLTTKAISLISRRSVTMNSLQSRNKQKTSQATSVPAGSRNSSASVTAGGSAPAASRNRPAVNSAGRPNPTGRVGQAAHLATAQSNLAGWSKRPAPAPVSEVIMGYRQQFASFVIQEGLSFNHFDNARLTRVIQNTLQPRYTQVSRATLKRDCMKAWRDAKAELIKGRETQFPVLAAMARDLLSVQASTVASESAFSTSRRVLLIRRTRLTPTSLEMCIYLKDHLDEAERIQHIASVEDRLEYEGQLHDVEVTTGEANTIFNEELALDEATSEARSSEADEEGVNLEQALI
ncbi:zinc finger BED domain-containing protein RICESLEEPER 2 [Tanacetum coccineum]|uniref:Zinc finger BED domain-containing protein RICESLEEPER 2 n=1 Tax=Tanacetum coccineum TaxID=301880 RepID=A0ABQ4ZQM9_9ASTR